MATTDKPNIQEGETVRPMTDEELEQWLADKTKMDAQIEAQQKAEAAKAAARQAVLDKLGLSQNEAQALLG
jgi:head-tail adaptor